MHIITVQKYTPLHYVMYLLLNIYHNTRQTIRKPKVAASVNVSHKKERRSITLHLKILDYFYVIIWEKPTPSIYFSLQPVFINPIGQCDNITLVKA